MENTMYSFKIVAPCKVEKTEIPMPSLEPNEVLVKVIATGVCTTDVELYDGSMSYYRDGLSKMPLTAGHEWSGTIAAVGEKVENVKVGDLVVGDISIGCSVCENCKKGIYHLCDNRTELGVIRYDGSMAEYLKTEGKNVYVVPEGITPEIAALCEPLATVLYAIRRTGINPGDNVVIFGDGPIGLLNAQLAKVCGAGKVAVIARKEKHRQLIEEKWGMKLIVGQGDATIPMVKEYFGKYADVVFEDTGNASIINTAVMMTAPGGKLCALSLTGEDTVPFKLEYVTSRDITVYGVLASPNSFSPALNMMQSGLLELDSIISHTYDFEDTPAALDFVKNSRDRLKVMIVNKN